VAIQCEGLSNAQIATLAVGTFSITGGGNLISQETKIVMPSAFSPIQ